MIASRMFAALARSETGILEVAFAVSLGFPWVRHLTKEIGSLCRRPKIGGMSGSPPATRSSGGKNYAQAIAKRVSLPPGTRFVVNWRNCQHQGDTDAPAVRGSRPLNDIGGTPMPLNGLLQNRRVLAVCLLYVFVFV